jgi:DNA-binding transcriptional LysR family regulator
MAQLDSDLLRTFLAVAETGSVTAGALRINRSQSATSLQIKQLEEIVGLPLFRRHGRGVTPTAAGDRLVPVARRVTRSLDAALADLRDGGLKGTLRVGIADDHGRSVLARIVADFAARHPEVELQVHCALGAGFDAALKSGGLDLAVFEVPEPSTRDEVLRRNALRWMCSREADFGAADPLPVAMFDRDCWWRDVALAGLEAAGRRYRTVFTSESAIGVRSAVGAGMAAGLLSEAAGDDELVPLPGMSYRHPSFLVLRRSRAAAGDAADAMSEAIRRVFGSVQPGLEVRS